MTKNVNVCYFETKNNEEIKGQISGSSLILVQTIHQTIVDECTKFKLSGPHSSREKCDENV